MIPALLITRLIPPVWWLAPTARLPSASGVAGVALLSSELTFLSSEPIFLSSKLTFLRQGGSPAPVAQSPAVSAQSPAVSDQLQSLGTCRHTPRCEIHAVYLWLYLLCYRERSGFVRFLAVLRVAFGASPACMG
jgi:hypothetical protein